MKIKINKLQTATTQRNSQQEAKFGDKTYGGEIKRHVQNNIAIASL
jgi:hypothetical protein